MSHKNTNLNLTAEVRKLEKELEMIYRDFNGLVRSFYEFNSLAYSRVSNSRSHKNENNSFITNDINNDINNAIKNKLTKKKLPNKVEIETKKLTKKKKRPIVWNAWVIDSSSESEDSD